MDAEKIKACLVSFSGASDAFEHLLQIIPSCADPPLMLSQIFPAISDRLKVKESVETIDRLKPGLVFIVLSSPI